MSAALDRPRAVRAGEELDAARLAAYLEATLGLVGPLTVEQFPGGHSNLTYLVRVGERELILRRPPFGSKVKSAHDMGREVRVLSALAPRFAKAPRPLAACDDEAVLGARFYVMEPVRGVILRRELPAGVTLDASLARQVGFAVAVTLAELHAVDYVAAGLGDFGKPAGYVARQVSGWTERYAGSQTDDLPVVGEVAAWLAAHLPPTGRVALIHNDCKHDNLVLDPADLARVVGVLDWEMATVGDPMMDLGTSLAYWVEAGDPQPLQMGRFGPTTLPGMPSRTELAARYAELTGASLDHVVFYYAFGLWKTAVVAQQIYYRFAQGLTQDGRFASFIFAVRILCEQARAAIERDRL